MNKTASTIPDHLWMHPDKVQQANRMIAVAVKLYRPRKVWALYSSGDDSGVSSHLAMSSGLCSGVATIDTTIAVKQSQEHGRSVAKRFGWPQRTLTPPMSYLDLCRRFGMPGPGGHNLIYQRLKERCVRQLIRESKILAKDRVMLITGCRVSESERRMGTALPITREGARIWVAPIINWNIVDKLEYQHLHGIPLNPVKKIIGISGECCCGAFAKPGERTNLAQHFPETEEHIRACEHAAASNCQPSAWGERPSKTQHLCQQCDRKNVDDMEAA